MRLGLLPALGGGLRDLRRSGQEARLVDGYLRPYARAFESVAYFSYLPESLAEFTDAPELLERVVVLAPSEPMARGHRALRMVRDHAADFRACHVLRCFQITGVIPALRVRRRFGVPYVTTYGFWYGRLSRPGPKRLLKSLVERLGLRYAAAVIATTEELRERAARLASRVELIPNGVDTARFAPRSRPAHRPGEPRRILSVGRLSPEKNLSAVMRATASLGADVSGPGTAVTLTLVGAGPLEAALRSEADHLGLGERVEFRGIVGQPRLPEVYGTADAFVLASFTEGHPKVLLEAMACGLPCMASDCAGNRSLITDGETGLLFDPHRPEELARCLRRVLDDPALARRLGGAARELIVSRYDLSALVAREIALLQDVGRDRR